MDQAIKSALRKYNGKQEMHERAPTTTSGRMIGWLALVMVLVCAFTFCVKGGYLGVDTLWDKICGIEIGDHTVGEIVQSFSQKIGSAFSGDRQTTQPINDSGESASVQTSFTEGKSLSAVPMVDFSA